MTFDPSRVRALCFDIDGTLSDTDDQLVQRLAGWLRPVSFLLPHKDALRCARWTVMGSEAPANFLIGIPDRLGVDSYLTTLWDYFHRPGSLRPFLLIPGVKEALGQLQPHFRMSVVSARAARSSLAFLRQYELLAYFPVIATALTCRHTKPYPDPVLWAARQMEVSPEHCLMIGDTTLDIRAGKAAGAQTVGVLSGFGEQEELRHCGADLILPSVAHIPAVLGCGEAPREHVGG